MIQLIGLMIGMYIVVRLTSFLMRKGEREESMIVQILSGVFLFLTILILIYLLFAGTDLFKNLIPTALGELPK